MVSLRPDAHEFCGERRILRCAMVSCLLCKHDTISSGYGKPPAGCARILRRAQNSHHAQWYHVCLANMIPYPPDKLCLRSDAHEFCGERRILRMRNGINSLCDYYTIKSGMYKWGKFSSVLTGLYRLLIRSFSKRGKILSKGDAEDSRTAAFRIPKRKERM
jgi:hypothetical protein